MLPSKPLESGDGEQGFATQPLLQARMKAEGRFEALATMGLAPIEPLIKTDQNQPLQGKKRPRRGLSPPSPDQNQKVVEKIIAPCGRAA